MEISEQTFLDIASNSKQEVPISEYKSCEPTYEELKSVLKKYADRILSNYTCSISSDDFRIISYVILDNAT